MSMLTGLLVWMLAKLFGLELAAEWGVIAFTLNYVPFIGPLIATVFPTALALVQFESWQTAVLIFASLNVIQFVVGSYIEPRVSGNALSISPSIVLFSVFFWTYIWGLFGAVIGVPVMIAVLTFCAQHPFEPVACRIALLGREGRSHSSARLKRSLPDWSIWDVQPISGMLCRYQAHRTLIPLPQITIAYSQALGRSVSAAFAAARAREFHNDDAI